VSPCFGHQSASPLTLELTSANPCPVLLPAGTPICHLVLVRVTAGEDAAGPLKTSVYEGLVQPVGPMLAAEFGPLLSTTPRNGPVAMFGATPERDAASPSENGSRCGVAARQTCVAAFVRAAVRTTSGVELDLGEVARSLDTALPPGAPNPWQLRISSTPGDWGVTVLAATRLIPMLFERHRLPLMFRHIRFNEIALEQYEDVFDWITRYHGSVAVGLDYGKLRTGGPCTHHVMRCERGSTTGTVCLRDDSDNSSSPRELRWDDLAALVRAVGDGFWIVGSGLAITPPHCLPLSSSTRE
jgi:hypothetical protein